VIPLVAVLWLIGCSRDASPGHAGPTGGTDPDGTTLPTDDPPDTDVPHDTGDPPVEPVWMSISGGGYHSHTAQAAWTMGMIEASGQDLDGVMANVAGIGTSSGSSWFVAQLAWSEPFRAALEDEPEAWGTTGYLGQTIDLFALGDPCAAWSGPAGVMCDNVEPLQPLFAVLGLPGVGALDWEAFVDHVVFAPFGMDTELAAARLDSPRLPWAEGKSIVFGATLLTDDVVLAEESGFPYDKDLYTAKPTDLAIPSLNKFTAAYLASVPRADLVAPSLFAPGELALDYTTNAFFDPPEAASTFPAAPALSVTLIQAAAVSSATGGAAASVQVVNESGYDDGVPLTDEEMASIAKDFAPAFRIGAAGFERFEPTYGLDASAADRAVRLCDSGFIDNTGVTFILRHLADNALLDDFTLVAFINTTYPLTLLGSVEITDNLAFLFGRGSTEPVDGMAELCSSGFCLDVRVPQVFESAGLDTGRTPWTWSDRGVNLSHLVIDVVTVDNPSLGIEAGHAGTLHVFVSQDEDSDVLPLEPAIFDTYADVLDVTREAIVDHGGYEELAAALRIE
jgi:hypothetical protein